MTASEFATWVLETLTNRTDAYGTYSDGQPFTAKEPLTASHLEKHFEGRAVVGLHAIGPGNKSRWHCIDVDAHDCPKPDALRRALEIFRTLKDRGCEPVLEDSGGGYHVWVVFEDPVPTEAVHAWIRPFVRPGKVEAFPKQARVAGDGCGLKSGELGSWVRLPGRHPRLKETWSRFWNWGAEAWMDWPEGLALFTDAPRCPAALVPAVAPRTGDNGQAAALDTLKHMGGEPTPGDAIRALEWMGKMPQAKIDNYDEWVKVGAILHGIDPSPISLAAWDHWSRQSKKYEPGACAERWPTFGSHPDPAGLGSLIRMAGGSEQDHAIEKLDAGAPPEGEPVLAPASPEERAELVANLRQAIGAPLDRWVQSVTEAGRETFRIVLADGTSIPCGNAERVLGYYGLRARVYAQTGILLKVGQKKWPGVCRHLARIREIEEVPELTTVGTMNEYIATYIKARDIHPDDPDTILSNKPFIRDQKLHISVPDMMDWVRGSRIGIKRQDLIRGLVYVGWTSRRIRAPMTTRAYWVAAETSSINSLVSVGDSG